MKTRLLLILLILSLFLACSETEDFEQHSEFDITGYWINQKVNDTVYTYEKSTSLEENQYCFGFKEKGEFIERKNSGWCATPPIHYDDFNGIWTMNDSIINIAVTFGGGMSFYKWKVTFLDHQKLSLIHIESNYRENEQK